MLHKNVLQLHAMVTYLPYKVIVLDCNGQSGRKFLTNKKVCMNMNIYFKQIHVFICNRFDGAN